MRIVRKVRILSRKGTIFSQISHFSQCKNFLLKIVKCAEGVILNKKEDYAL